MPLLEKLLTLLACYALGCIVPGYYGVRLSTGEDLRKLGTGSAGARNAGRVLGKTAYFIIAILDIAKGSAAVWLAGSLGLQNIWLGAAALSVTAGHIWPLQLGFRGGKGIATAGGACFVLDFPIAVSGLLLVIPLRFFLSPVLALLTTFSLGPLYAWGFQREGWEIVYYTASAGLVLFTHRRNLAEEFRNLKLKAKAKRP